jgi:tetratricopeptide (TPR) repeat protein
MKQPVVFKTLDSFLLCLVLGFCTSAAGQTASSFEEAFQSGLASYSSKKFDEARLAFGQAIEKNPSSSQALTNMGLTEFQLGNKGAAVAFLRKAQWLDPDFSTPKNALEFILPQLEIKEIPHEIQVWESLRARFVAPFSMTAFLALTGISLFSTGWLFLAYVGRRREATRDEKPYPPFPVIPVIIGLIFFVCLALTASKIIDHQIPRGTVVAEKVFVHAAPDEKSAQLFELYAGLEVLLKVAKDDWVQITYPGALTGWIPRASLLQTSGRTLW